MCPNLAVLLPIKYSLKDLCRVIGKAALANHNYFAQERAYS